MLPFGNQAPIRQGSPWHNGCWKIITTTHPLPQF
jgi:hypothetical protein